MNGAEDELFIVDKSGSELDERRLDVVYDFMPPNETTVARNSTEFMGRKPTHGKRYHLADSLSRFRPGRISRELRKALGLGRHDIPIHIYRMRSLGYPPGWLKKAAVGSNLAIFDSVSLEGSTGHNKVSYNKSALVRYPGFNVELDPSVRDDCRYLKCPSMQKHHMLDNFYSSLSNEAVRCNVATSNNKYSSCREKEATETVIILSGSESGETDSDSSGDEEVANGSGGVRPTENSSPINEPEQGTTTPSHPPTVESDSPNESVDQSSVSVVSPSKRPCLEAFSVGVQPYRPYENLPDVHGGYQRVLKSLKKSRGCLNVQSNGSGLVNSSDTGLATPSVQRDRNNSSYSSR
ncbi:unnamed protein product [Trichobilharzia szidati]|nr:unnamed protein product [Trichobilharzia szidati]